MNGRTARAHRQHDGGALLMGDDFCGISGSTRGGTRVRYVEAGWGGNHWKPAIDCHKANYPDAEHPCGKGDPGALRPWEARVFRRVLS